MAGGRTWTPRHDHAPQRERALRSEPRPRTLQMRTAAQERRTQRDLSPATRGTALSAHRWAPLRKEPWLGKVIHNDEIYELGAGAPGRETYHMDIAPDDGTIVDDYSYARGARVCRMRYPGDSDEEEEFFGDDDDD